MKLLHLYISPAHNFVGHHGLPPGETPMVEVDEVECVAGQGLRGDRYFGHKEDYKGQVTFFAHETFERLAEQFGESGQVPSVFRRNIITRGVDLNELIGQEFEVQGVRFFGMEECKPCYWMDKVYAEGAELALRGYGGLRAKVLSDGVLRAV
jgi:MOSC domain-containing protein YiiM